MQRNQAAKLLLGHSKVESTVRYLGIEVDDALTIAEQVGQVLLMQALGTSDIDFYHGLIHQLVNAASKGQEPDEAATNFLLAIIKAVQPKDEVETMLAAQMAALHAATMTLARRLANVENIAQQDSAERALNKCARTYVLQMEALKRYRTGGQQKIVVQHVNVNAGGQAIVGDVIEREGVSRDSDAATQISSGQQDLAAFLTPGGRGAVEKERTTS